MKVYERADGRGLYLGIVFLSAGWIVAEDRALNVQLFRREGNAIDWLRGQLGQGVGVAA